MRYISVDQIKHFDLRDHYWELASWNGQELSIWVAEPAVLAGEFAGRCIEKALVTFRGVRMEQAFFAQEGSERSVTPDEAMEQFAREPMLVFSYYPEEKGCELCGLGGSAALGMMFIFDSVSVEWDAFAEAPAGELIMK